MANLIQRPPIVTVLGHVDHGKTTLLDKIRNTSVQIKEAGGITQKIGASVITKNSKDITFIDTPGHSAFSNMRQQGAKIADIAILVIASGEGVKPQTKEAIEYINLSKTPFFIAATKTDLPSSDIEKVKADLLNCSVLVEGSGGNIPLVPVSAKTGVGIDDLLDMILLLSEMNEIKGDPEADVEAYVFETGKDKRGPFASVVVKNGTLKSGSEISVSGVTSKIRGMFDHMGNSIQEISPGYPCQIIGFNTIPTVGSRIWENGKQKESAVVSEKKQDDIQIESDELKIIVKAANAGSLEAVVKNLASKVKIIDCGVGDINESDVFMAKSTGADIYLFEKKIPSSIKKLAESEKINIYTFDIIYHLFEKIDESLKSDQIKEKGTAQILMEFPFNNQKVAGCKMINGIMSKNDTLIIKRADKQIGQTKAVSLKKGKNDVPEVKQGEEFGVIFAPRVEFSIGDMISSLQ